MEFKEKYELIFTAAIGGAYLLLFVLGEWIYRRFKVKGENTRKMVHVLGGGIALLCPVLIGDHRLIFLLCILFVVILIVSKKIKQLSSIHDIGRSSAGSYLFPIAVYFCFYIFTLTNNYLYFYLPVIVLAVSDPFAAYIGKKYPLGKYNFFDQGKTISGSLAFFVSAFISCCFLITVLTSASIINSIALAASVALYCAILEGMSTGGFDNLTIPLGAVAMLWLLH